MNEEITVTCPREGEQPGCGTVFTAAADEEGYFDCPHCGLFFKFYEGHDFAWLKGATIVAVGEGEVGTRLTFALPDLIQLGGGEITSSVQLEVWQDEEGNGPGYLALVAGSLPTIPMKGAT